MYIYMCHGFQPIRAFRLLHFPSFASTLVDPVNAFRLRHFQLPSFALTIADPGRMLHEMYLTCMHVM